MPRWFVLTIIGSMLGGCVSQPVLPPREVISKMIFVTETLDSFSYSVHVTGSLSRRQSLSGSAVIGGSVLRNSAWSSDATLILDRSVGRTTNSIDGQLRLRSPGNGILYIDIADISGPLAASLQRALSGAVTGGWARLDHPAPERQTVPDAAEIDRQVEAIEILRDHTTSSSNEYEYSVRVPAQFVFPEFTNESEHLTGVLFIDRRSFLLTRARWSGENFRLPLGVLSFDADITYGEWNRATLPVMPLSTGATLDLKSIFAIILE